MNEVDTTIAFLIDVARDAITQRAARDEKDPDQYDAKQDPEGYITSLLNALCHWSHRHGIDWDNELARAQSLFEQDLAEMGEPCPETLSQPTIQELCCPDCGQNECFVIEVSERVLMFRDGVVLQQDAGETWDNASYCRCPACQHTGVVHRFHTPNQTKEKKAHGRHLQHERS